MDANKLKELQRIGYEIRATCGTCEHGEFRAIRVGDPWGTCKVHQYQHQKHTGEKRQLSIFAGGHCSSWRANLEQMKQFGTFTEFFREGS